MIALVTGSTGFIGSALCHLLVKKGWRVRAFRQPANNLELLDGLQVEHVLGDLTDPESVLTAVNGVDVVFHTAGIIGANADPVLSAAVTVGGTRTMLQAALQFHVKRLVYTSSAAALGVPEYYKSMNLRPSLLDENHTWNYHSRLWPYGYAKYLAELEVQNAVAAGLDVVIVNPTAVIGPGDLNRLTISPVVQVANRKMPVITDGGMNAMHLTDVVDGHLAALENGKTGERYILGGQNITLKSLMCKIAEIVKVPPPRLHIPSRLLRPLANPINRLGSSFRLPVPATMLNLAGYYLYYDTRKMREELGLKELHSLESAIKDAASWFSRRNAIKMR